MHKSKIKISVLVLMSTLALVGCSNQKGAESQDTTITREAIVEVGDIREEISLSGNIEAVKINSVESGQRSEVEEVYILPNTYVSEGDDIILLENGAVIEAPYDGKISKINVSQGQSVDSTTSMFNIVDDSSFMIETSIDESDITKVSVGQEVEVNVSAIEKDLVGVVESIDGEASNSGQSTTFGIKIIIESSDSQNFEGIYSGMSSQLNIVIKESNDILLVPVQAVSSRKGVNTVDIKNGEEVMSVEVEVGSQDSSYVEITSGLKEGDIVVYTQSNANNSMSNTMFGGGMQGMMPEGMDRESMKEMMGGGAGRQPSK